MGSLNETLEHKYLSPLQRRCPRGRTITLKAERERDHPRCFTDNPLNPTPL